MPRATDQKVRQHIERGLARYGQGELQAAFEEWQAALALDAGNHEVLTLLDFVQGKMPGTPEDGGEHDDKDQRTTDPVIPSFDEWRNNEPTNPQQLTELPPEATPDYVDDDEPTGTHRVKRETLRSPIPKILAQITDPEWAPPTTREDGAPEAPLFNEDTRRVGSEPHTTAGGRVPSTAERPSDDSAREARQRAAELVDQCRGQLERGNFEGAVASAEEALREGEQAPLPGIPEVIEPARPLFERAFEGYVGPPTGVPTCVMSPGALAGQELDHRAGFLLSRIDGLMSIEHLLDIASMPRFEALRILAGLLRVKAIRVE